MLATPLETTSLQNVLIFSGLFFWCLKFLLLFCYSTFCYTIVGLKLWEIRSFVPFVMLCERINMRETGLSISRSPAWSPGTIIQSGSFWVVHQLPTIALLQMIWKVSQIKLSLQVSPAIWVPRCFPRMCVSSWKVEIPNFHITPDFPDFLCAGVTQNVINPENSDFPDVCIAPNFPDSFAPREGEVGNPGIITF